MTLSRLWVRALTILLLILFSQSAKAQVAVDDPLISGLPGQINVADVLANDVFNGTTPVSISDVDLNVVTPAISNGGPVPVINTATGFVDIPSGTPPGNYSITYEICEVGDTSTCDRAIASVEVTAPVFRVDVSRGNACVAAGGTLGSENLFTAFDNGTFGVGSGAQSSPAFNPYPTPINGTYRQYVGRTANNQFNPPGYGEYSIVGNIQVARNRFQHEGGITDALDPNGRFFHADPDNSNPPSFTATVTGLTPAEEVEVSFFAADAELNPSAPKNSISVLVNGAPAYNTGPISNPTASQMVWYKYSALVTPDASGNAAVEVRTNEAGRGGRDVHIDTISVRRCVLVEIDAEDDDEVVISDVAGGTTPSVFENDTLNDAPFADADVNLTPGTAPSPASGSISMDPTTGIISVAAGTTPGTYTYPYEICAASAPSICDTAEAIVTVGSGDIGVVKSSVLNDSNGDGFAQAGETITYTYLVSNPGDFPLSNVTLSETTFSGAGSAPVPFRTGGDDGDDILQTTEVWTYTATYALQGADLTAGEVTNQATASGQTPEGDTVSDLSDSGNASDGNGIGTPGGGAGNDDPTETPLPSTPIVAQDDVRTGIIDPANAVPAALDIFADNGSGTDTLDGDPTGSSEVTVTVAPGNVVPAGLMLNSDGTIDVAVGTGPATYSFDYQICETANLGNCDIATATLTVGAGAIGIVKGSEFNDENGDTFGQVGETITFTYTVTNLGNLPLGPVDVVETGFTGNGVVPTPSFTGGDSNSNSILDLTEVWTYQATYTLIASDLQDGTVDNQAEARAQTPGGTQVTDASDSQNPTDGNGSGTPGGGAGNDEPTTTPIPSQTIVAQDDPVPGVLDISNGSLTGVINVFADNSNGPDTLGGAPTGTGEAEVEVVLANPPPEGITLNADGTVDVASTTTPGAYSFDYELCEIANPSNCDTATVTLTIGAPQIGVVKSSAFNDELVDDDVGQAGETITYTYIVTNLGTLPLTDVTLSETTFTTGAPSPLAPTPVFQSGDGGVAGTLDVGESWTYTATYTLTAPDLPRGRVDNQATATGTSPNGSLIGDLSDSSNAGDGDGASTPGEGPGNDDLTTTTFSSPLIAANDDNLTAPQDATVAIPVVLNILTATGAGSEDTLNSLQPTINTDATAAAGEVDLSLVTAVPPQLTFDPSTGDVGIVAGAAAGTYTFDYQICSSLNPTVCDTATVEVTVGQGAIGVLKESVFDDANLDGFAQVGETITYIYTVSNEGDFDLTPVTLAETVFSGIGAAPTPTLVAASDTGSDGVLSVGETWIYNATYTLQAEDIAAGDVTNSATATGTSPNGSLVQDISDSRNPDDGNGVATSGTGTGNDDPTVTPLATALIVAENDNVSGIDGITGASDVMNVLENNGSGTDTLGGNPTNLSQVTISVLTPAAPLIPAAPVPVLDPSDGSIDVPPGTPAGTYEITYQICESALDTNCDDAVATIVVDAPTIVAEDDDFTATPSDGAGGDITPTVFDNDTLNGEPFEPAEVTVSIADLGGLTGGTINPDGTISVPPGTPAGSYPVAYEICDVVNPSICDTAIATIRVADIDAIAETFDTIDGEEGGITPSILTSDTLSGVLIADPADVVIIVNSATGGLSLDPVTNGIIVPPETDAGTYTLEYTICDAENAAICDTVTETVVVAVIMAVPETFADISAAGGTTPNSILDSDTVNGGAATLANVNLTVTAIDPELTLNADNTITLGPNTPAGEYALDYEICDVDNPTICAEATETISVLPEGALEVIKTQTLIDNGDGVEGVGDTLRYTITIQNTGNVDLDNVTLTDTLSNGNGTEIALTSGPNFQSATTGSSATSLLIGGTATYTATFLVDVDTVTSGATSNSAVAEGNPVPPTTYTGPPLDPVSDISDQGDPLDGDDNPTVRLFPASALTGLGLTKTADIASVQRGGVVPYTIIASNPNPANAASTLTVDTLPVGFVYVPDSALVDGVAVTPTVEDGRVVTFPNIIIPPTGQVIITLSARVGPGVAGGEHVNEARVQNPATREDLAPAAYGSILVEVEQVFDCTEIIGKVFIDHNGNGRQDPSEIPSGQVSDQTFFDGKFGVANDVLNVPEGEVGVPDVRLATVDGSVITTDQYGRFSVPCAALPGRTGSNFILKLDTRSLPSGYRVTTENPRVMRVTAGMLHEMNFGIAIGRVVRVDLSTAAFERDEDRNVVLRPELRQGLTRALQNVSGETVSLRLSFFVSATASTQDVRQARALMEMVDDEIRRQWRTIGRVRLLVEQHIVRTGQ